MSICLPTGGQSPADSEAPQPPTALRRLHNLLRAARTQLRGLGLEASMVHRILEPGEALVDDERFWESHTDGVTLYCHPGGFRRFRLPCPLPELAMVASHFFLRPLLSQLASNTRFYLLALGGRGAHLYEATGGGSRELSLAPLDPPLSEDETTLLTAFRALDKSVRRALSEAQAPLILHTRANWASLYRHANTYPHLQMETVPGEPGDMPDENLLEKANSIARSHFAEAERMITNELPRATGGGLTSCDLPRILHAAFCGRVRVLFLSAGMERWGSYDAETGELRSRDRNSPDREDLLSLAAAYTFMNCGVVYSLSPDRVPGTDGLAAILRPGAPNA